MKKLIVLLSAASLIFAFSCKKEVDYTRLENLTTNVWMADSLLADGEDAGGPGQMLEKFNGEAQFEEDGTGTFGAYEGTWYFSDMETKLVIASDSLPFTLTMNILELTHTSLKTTTVFPNISNPTAPINIRMTFIAE